MIEILRALYRRVQRLRNCRDAELLKSSPLFDGDWYLKQNPDVYDASEDPVDHYLRSGWWQGRDPSPYFRGNLYLALHPEARLSAKSPLIHYLRTVGTRPPDVRVEGDWEFLSGILAAKRLPIEQELRPATGKSAKGPIARAAVASAESAPLNVVLINYGAFDSNSGMHVFGFANALSALGHRVVVSAMGTPGQADGTDASGFLTVPNRDIRENPGILAKLFSGNGNGTPDLVHCWTPRPVNWSVVRAVTREYKCPYLVHFEDNEMAVARAFGSVRAGTPVSKLPPGVHEFVAGAAGATIIVDALREVLPQGLPAHLLQPGVDGDLFAHGLDSAERARLRTALAIPPDASIIVYPGNIHPANADDMFSLYAAIHALNALGHKVHLIRTGEDTIAVIDPRFAKLSMRYVTHLGWVRRERLIELLKLAHVFVQPGGPDDFNSYRLPSKLPEFLAMGRPVVTAQTNIGLLMQDRVNAILMQRGDAPEITHCVEALINDPALVDRVGREGRRFALEHFDWGRSAVELAAFYRKLLKRRPDVA